MVETAYKSVYLKMKPSNTVYIMSLKILIIRHFFYPKNSARTLWVEIIFHVNSIIKTFTIFHRKWEPIHFFVKTTSKKQKVVKWRFLQIYYYFGKQKMESY